MAKKIVGLIEKVKITGEKSVKTFALFDTGAKRTSVDTRLAGRAKLGPVLSMVKIKHASLKEEIRRPVVKASIRIKGKDFDSRVSVQDREHMTFPMIIGRDILAGNFIVDPNKNKDMFKKKKIGKSQVNLTKYIS